MKMPDLWLFSGTCLGQQREYCVRYCEEDISVSHSQPHSVKMCVYEGPTLQKQEQESSRNRTPRRGEGLSSKGTLPCWVILSADLTSLYLRKIFT